MFPVSVFFHFCIFTQKYRAVRTFFLITQNIFQSTRFIFAVNKKDMYLLSLCFNLKKDPFRIRFLVRYITETTVGMNCLFPTAFAESVNI